MAPENVFQPPSVRNGHKITVIDGGFSFFGSIKLK
jgi:hypothetical protein